LHLIYSRFWTKVMRDLGLIKNSEPATRLFTQGMVIKNGAKMSKSKGNVVSPDEMISRYGADATRMYSLFAAPPDRDLEWQEDGVAGVSRFLSRVYRLTMKYAPVLQESANLAQQNEQTPADLKLLRRRLAEINSGLSARRQALDAKPTGTQVPPEVRAEWTRLLDAVTQSSVEAQPAYERLQDEEEQAPEEHSPPFSRLLLPAPSVTEPQPDARPERAARLAARRAIPPPLEKPMRKFEQGIYTVTDVRWGMALDLSNGDNRSPIAFGSHGWENQQVSN